MHGIFVSSLFSTLFGRSFSGSIYVGQTLSFKKPVYVGSEVTARMEIAKIEEKRKGRLLTCKTTVVNLHDKNNPNHKQGSAIEGEAQVLVPYLQS